MKIKGLASSFGSVINARVPTIIQPGSFKQTLREHANVFPLLWMHNSEQPIGLSRAWESTRGLEFEAQLSDTQLGREIGKLITDRIVSDVSVGFDVEKDYVAPWEGIKTRFITQIALFEISLVNRNFAADPKAFVEMMSIDDEIAKMAHAYQVDEDFEISRMAEKYEWESYIKKRGYQQC